MNGPKTVRVEIEFEDGKIISLSGDDAQKWQELAQGMSMMHYIHGGAGVDLPWKETQKGPPIGDCDACAGAGGNKDCMCGGTGKAFDAMVYLRKRLLRAEEALEFYGDPENYHAIGFFMDPPCGGFAEDFTEDHGHPDYPRPMPGAKAREVLSTPVPE